MMTALFDDADGTEEGDAVLSSLLGGANEEKSLQRVYQCNVGLIAIHSILPAILR